MGMYVCLPTVLCYKTEVKNAYKLRQCSFLSLDTFSPSSDIYKANLASQIKKKKLSIQ